MDTKYHSNWTVHSKSITERATIICDNLAVTATNDYGGITLKMESPSKKVALFKGEVEITKPAASCLAPLTVIGRHYHLKCNIHSEFDKLWEII